MCIRDRTRGDRRPGGVEPREPRAMAFLEPLVPGTGDIQVVLVVLEDLDRGRVVGALVRRDREIHPDPPSAGRYAVDGVEPVTPEDVAAHAGRVVLVLEVEE